MGILAGLVAGLFVFSSVARWLYTLHGIAKESAEPRGRPGRLFMAAIFSSAPWLCAVIGGIAYQERNEAWLRWALAGMLAALVYLAVLALRVLGRRKRLAAAADAPGPEGAATPRDRRLGEHGYVAEVVISVVFALLGVRFVPGEMHLSLVVQVLLFAMLFSANLVVFWVIWTILHPKPWVDRRKDPR